MWCTSGARRHGKHLLQLANCNAERVFREYAGVTRPVFSAFQANGCAFICDIQQTGGRLHPTLAVALAEKHIIPEDATNDPWGPEPGKGERIVLRHTLLELDRADLFEHKVTNDEGVTGEGESIYGK